MSSAVFDALRRWRSRRAKEMQKPSYVVFDDKTLLGIAEKRPATLSALGDIKGVGPKKKQDYGNEVLDIVRGLGGDAAGGARGGSASTSTLAAAWGMAAGAPGEGSEKKTTASAPSRTAPVFESKKKPSELVSAVTEMSVQEARDNYETKMNAEQRFVVDAALRRGRNVFFHGAAGTGKSFVLHTLVALLREKHGGSADAVAVTAPTGIAAVAIGGCTIHKFIGAGLCAGSPRFVADKVMKSEKATRRWRETNVLIVDETSMLDADIMQKLDFIGRAARGEYETPFGGMQLVFTGDFYQLPPVSKGNERGGPPFAFDCDAWRVADFLAVELTKVLRQKDPTLVEALREVRGGEVPVGGRASSLFRSLQRPLPPNAEGVLPTRLHSVNANVDAENRDELLKLPGEAVLFEARDAGDDAAVLDVLRKNCQAPQTLTLKLGAQVVLIKNVDDALVNGSRGVVKGFVARGETEFARHKSSFRIHPRRVAEAERAFPRWPLVAFDNGRVLAVGPGEFSASAGKKAYADRLQVPLKLAWALTVHKSQGMTLSRVEVNLRDAFDYGQVYVALSRATCAEGLCVRGFDERKIKAHPKVKQFYASLRDATSRDKENANDANDADDAGDFRETPRRTPPGDSRSVTPWAPTTRSQPSARDERPVTCFKCGEAGHWARECPRSATAPAAPGPYATKSVPADASRFGGYTTCDPPSP